jgi:hypothetical protein
MWFFIYPKKDRCAPHFLMVPLMVDQTFLYGSKLILKERLRGKVYNMKSTIHRMANLVFLCGSRIFNQLKAKV